MVLLLDTVECVGCHPEWKAAKPGQRVRMNRTGWTGTVVNVNRFGVRVLWDQSGYEGVAVAPAFDLTAI